MAWQEHCPIGDLLGPDRKSQHLEYKSTLRIRTTGGPYKPLETATPKTVAAFANSREGGTLLIGVTTTDRSSGWPATTRHYASRARMTATCSNCASAASSRIQWEPRWPQMSLPTSTPSTDLISAAYTFTCPGFRSAPRSRSTRTGNDQKNGVCRACQQRHERTRRRGEGEIPPRAVAHQV
ncbi:MAG: ATP-binding protein [Actinobacteria bacterium]|nr:ATP-binding protein [Actinomycetota bacterium]